MTEISFLGELTLSELSYSHSPPITSLRPARHGKDLC